MTILCIVYQLFNFHYITSFSKPTVCRLVNVAVGRTKSDVKDKKGKKKKKKAGFSLNFIDFVRTQLQLNAAKTEAGLRCNVVTASKLDE